MSEAAQGFLPEAYYQYVEGENPRRTMFIGKRAISGWKLSEGYLIHHLLLLNSLSKFFLNSRITNRLYL